MNNINMPINNNDAFKSFKLPQYKKNIETKETKHFSYSMPTIISTVASTSLAGGILGNFYCKKSRQQLAEKIDNNFTIFLKEQSSKGIKEYDNILNIFTMCNLFKDKKIATISDNCYMFEGKDKKLGEAIIDWISNQAKVNYIINDIKNYNLDEVLDDVAKKCKNKKELTFINVKNMDLALNPKLAEFSNIESMKSIMTDCGEYYNSILLFHTENSSLLDDIATAPHRISKKFNLNNMKDFDKFKDLYTSYKNKNILVNTKYSIKKILTKSIGFGAIVGAAILAGIKIIKKTNEKGTKNGYQIEKH